MADFEDARLRVLSACVLSRRGSVGIRTGDAMNAMRSLLCATTCEDAVRALMLPTLTLSSKFREQMVRAGTTLLALISLPVVRALNPLVSIRQTF